jgi:hypothetical protein
MATFNATEKTEATNQLNFITGVYRYQGYTPTALFNYMELIQKLKTGSRYKIFTNNLTAFPHPSIPNLYITNLGSIVFNLIFDNIQNPYTTGKLQNTWIHPEIALLSQLMLKHNLHNFNISAYQHIEHACETCFADFKVHIQTRVFITQFRSWITSYRACNNTYDRFLEFIYGESNKFEIQSLVIQRKRPNGLEPTFGDPGFRDMSAYEIVREKCDEIIQDVWRKRNQNNVLGIISREEIDIDQTCSVRLIFFVKKEYSDLVPFKDMPLYEVLESYFIELNHDRIALGNIGTINSGIAPLFQGQEQNYYDLNQIHVGNRLNVLKAQLVIPNYWFRISDSSCSLNIERGQAQYNR